MIDNHLHPNSDEGEDEYDERQQEGDDEAGDVYVVLLPILDHPAGGLAVPAGPDLVPHLAPPGPRVVSGDGPGRDGDAQSDDPGQRDAPLVHPRLARPHLAGLRGVRLVLPGFYSGSM